MNAGATQSHPLRRGPLEPYVARRTALTCSFKSFAPPREAELRLSFLGHTMARHPRFFAAFFLLLGPETTTTTTS